MKRRWIAVVVVAGVMSAMSVSWGPAQAGTGSEWGDPQTISSRYGRSVVLSADGGTAAWIRTDEVGNPLAPGPVWASTYGGERKGWKKPVVVPGTAESSAVRLSDDGRMALVEAKGVGYGIAERVGGEWSAPATIASGTGLWGGELSRSGDVVAWVDYAGHPVPGTLWARSRADDGTWGAPQKVGSVHGMASSVGDLVPVMSHNGSTLVWLDETNAVRAAVRAEDGTWSPTGLVKQYAELPMILDAELSASGKRLVWAGAGLVTSVRTGLAWSPPDNIGLGGTRAFALSPKGSLVAWAGLQDQCCLMMVRQWKGGAWTKRETLGKAGALSTVLGNDSTVAWVKANGATTVLRTATLVKGKWTVSGKIAKKLRRPALSLDGSTLAWSATDSGRMVSVRR